MRSMLVVVVLFFSVPATAGGIGPGNYSLFGPTVSTAPSPSCNRSPSRRFRVEDDPLSATTPKALRIVDQTNGAVWKIVSNTPSSTDWGADFRTDLLIAGFSETVGGRIYTYGVQIYRTLNGPALLPWMPALWIRFRTYGSDPSSDPVHQTARSTVCWDDVSGPGQTI